MKCRIPIFGGPCDGAMFEIDHRLSPGDELFLNTDRYLFVMTNGSPRLAYQTWRKTDD